MMANRKQGVIYIGVTSNIIKRTYQHKEKLIEGFTKKYNLDKLVYFEATSSVEEAIKREKQLKNWKRGWKTNLIEKTNPKWQDLYNNLLR